MEQRLARSRCFKSVFVLSTFFIQVPFSSYKLAFLVSTRLRQKAVYNFALMGALRGKMSQPFFGKNLPRIKLGVIFLQPASLI